MTQDTGHLRKALNMRQTTREEGQPEKNRREDDMLGEVRIQGDGAEWCDQRERSSFENWGGKGTRN